MTASTFPLFSRFPPELRLEIWRKSLPDLDNITMYKYSQGCWGPRGLPKSEGDQLFGTMEGTIDFDFCHEMLDGIPVDLPLAFVNREARSAALAWMHKRGVEMRFDKERKCNVFEQRFDPRRDALFISISKWDDFYLGPSDRLAQSDLSSHTVNSNTGLRHIAIPYVGTDYSSLFEVLHWFPHLEVLFIVLDVRTNRRSETMIRGGNREEARTLMQYQKWKVEDAREKTLVWNGTTCNFEWRGGAGLRNISLYKTMLELAGQVHERLVKRGTGSFKIQPVYTVEE